MLHCPARITKEKTDSASQCLKLLKKQCILEIFEKPEQNEGS